MSETFNGWANYPTWAVNLCLTNDARTYKRWVAAAAAAETVAELADQIQEALEDGTPEAVHGTVYADLLGHALTLVNWYEIAEDFTRRAQEARQ